MSAYLLKVLWVMTRHRVMSALPPIADICQCRWNVRKVPQAEIASPSLTNLFSRVRVASSYVEDLRNRQTTAAPLARIAFASR